MKIDLENLDPVSRKSKELLHKENKGIIELDSKVLYSKEESIAKDPYHIITDHEIKVLNLVREGMAITDIAEHLELERKDVSKVLKKEHILYIMKEIGEEQRIDLKNALVKADRRLKEIIEDGKDKDSLKAIDIAYKVTGRYNASKEDEESGEAYLMDLIKGNKIENVNVQINNTEKD